MIPLGLLHPGEMAEVVKILAGNDPCAHDPCARIEDMGFREGKLVEVLNNRGGGPLLLKIDESRLAMGRGMAMKIMVRRR